MLSKLFEFEEKKEPDMVEIKFQKLTRDEWNELEEKVSRTEHDNLKEKHKANCEAFLNMLDRIGLESPIIKLKQMPLKWQY